MRTASELHLDGVDQSEIGAHVHATVAEHDLIQVANFKIDEYDVALGPDPAAAGFGGQVFTSAPGTDGFGGLSSTTAPVHSESFRVHGSLTADRAAGSRSQPHTRSSAWIRRSSLIISMLSSNGGIPTNSRS